MRYASQADIFEERRKLQRFLTEGRAAVYFYDICRYRDMDFRILRRREKYDRGNFIIL